MIETLLAMDIWVVATFIGAGIVLNLTPGADVIFTVASGISGGARVGVAAAVGITMGSILHLKLAAVGISAAIAAIPGAYKAIRYVGAAYLVYLAWKSWTAPAIGAAGHGETSLGPAIRRGFVTNVLNPKVGLFVLAFLPQFTDPTIGPLWHQIVFLGLLFIANGLVITAAYGAFAGVLGSKLKSAGGVLNKLSAILFGGLAARLALN